MKLTQAQEREIVAIEAGINDPILEIPYRRFSIWAALIDKRCIKVGKSGLPELTALGQSEYHRIYMRAKLTMR